MSYFLKLMSFVVLMLSVDAWAQSFPNKPIKIIVAFTHDNNQSSRRIPPSETPPACFWGFPKEYLVFIHGLVDVQIEDDIKGKKTSKR